MIKSSTYKTIILILSVAVIGLLLFILRVRPPKALPPPVKLKGKIAIVLDDWGYNLNNLNILDGIPYPLTCSILPNLNYTGRIAEELSARGYEIILHCPMEPHEKYNLEQNTILISMGEEEIKNILDEDLAGIAHVKGVSNHMGSRATEDTRVVSIVFKELKHKRLYFLDSYVSAKSVCPSLAKKIGVGFAKRDVFLDNIEDETYIRSQLYKLKMRARVYGRAIGIGHDRKITLEALREVMPQIEKEGYKFVFLSELLN